MEIIMKIYVEIWIKAPSWMNKKKTENRRRRRGRGVIRRVFDWELKFRERKEQNQNIYSHYYMQKTRNKNIPTQKNNHVIMYDSTKMLRSIDNVWS